MQCPFLADSVAKVFLQHGTQILRAVGAAIEWLFEGLHYPVMNSQATSVKAWRLHRSAITARLVYSREIDRTAFWDFCNTICTKRTLIRRSLMSATGGKADLLVARTDVRNWPILLKKSFLVGERNFSASLARSARGDVRDHIGSLKNDHRPPYASYSVVANFGKFAELLGPAAVIDRRHLAHLNEAEGIVIADAELFSTTLARASSMTVRRRLRVSKAGGFGAGMANSKMDGLVCRPVILP
jgi:hypothetical protein